MHVQHRKTKKEVEKMQMYRQQIEFKPEEVLVYLRKSRSDDPTLTVEEVLQNHETILDEWCVRNLGEKVPEKNKFREVVSGETLKERPEINVVLRMVESPKMKAVAVVEPQRLTRGDLEDIGRLMKLLKHTNTYVITPQKIYDLRDEYDWDALERELKRGNDYLEYTKKILNRGKLLSVSQGNYIASVPPYGFKKISVMDGKKKCPTLEEHPEEANVVRMIFDMYANKNMGRTAICYRLDDLGIKPPKGKQWSPTAVKEMLRNIHYIGKVRWNWRNTVKIVEDGEIKTIRPQNNLEEYLIYEGRHEGIVSKELFDAVQERLGKNHRVTTRTKIRNPFASLLYCRKCGKSAILKMYKHKENKAHCSPRIMCSDQSRCGSGSCLFEELIDRVADILKECIEDFEIRIQNNEGDSIKLHANLIKTLEKKLEELNKKEENQWELQSDPDESKRMPPEIFKKLNEKLLKEKEEIQQALCKAYESMPEPVDYEEKITIFSEALQTLKNPEADVDLKNVLLKQCIERIDFYREKPKRNKKSGILQHGGWSNPPIELDVKLRV